MDFDLSTKNYSINDLKEIFELTNTEHLTKRKIEDKYYEMVNNVENEEIGYTEKSNIKTFLEKAYHKLLLSLNDILKDEDNNISSISNGLFQPMSENKIYNVADKFIIEKGNSNATRLINPLKQTTMVKILNINTTFRDFVGENNENSNDFIIGLPNMLKNVIEVSLTSFQLSEKSHYTISEKYGNNKVDISTIKVDISGGNYTGAQLATELNKKQADVSFNYNEISNKFDISHVSTGVVDISFNVPQNRPIQLNLGWLMGFRKPSYSISSSNLKQLAESVYDNSNKYFFLELDDYNNNYSNTLISPFQRSVLNNNGIIAKIPKYISSANNTYNINETGDDFTRRYFGPVNIDKLRVRLMDEYGRTLDINNADYSFTLKVTMLYETN